MIFDSIFLTINSHSFIEFKFFYQVICQYERYRIYIIRYAWNIPFSSDSIHSCAVNRKILEVHPNDKEKRMVFNKKITCVYVKSRCQLARMGRVIQFHIERDCNACHLAAVRFELCMMIQRSFSLSLYFCFHSQSFALSVVFLIERNITEWKSTFDN